MRSSRNQEIAIIMFFFPSSQGPDLWGHLQALAAMMEALHHLHLQRPHMKIFSSQTYTQWPSFIKRAWVSTFDWSNWFHSRASEGTIHEWFRIHQWQKLPLYKCTGDLWRQAFTVKRGGQVTGASDSFIVQTAVLARGCWAKLISVPLFQTAALWAPVLPLFTLTKSTSLFRATSDVRMSMINNAHH